MSDDPPPEFAEAGRVLAARRLVKDAEGNLSAWDGRTLRITRTGSRLGELGPGDVLEGTLKRPPDGASSDLAVHVAFYERHGPGAVVHGHPPGSPAGEEPGKHGAYRWSVRGLADAVEALPGERVR